MSSIALCAYAMDECSLDDAFDRVRSKLQLAVPDAAFTGVVWADLAGRRLLCSRHEPHAEVHACRQGIAWPALDTLRSGRVTIIDDTSMLGGDEAFRRAAAARGLRSVACVPMAVGTHTVGALTLYGLSPGLFGPATASHLAAFATEAAYVLLNHQAYERTRAQCANLERALVTRAPIEQAKGIVMASLGCSPDEAFEMLRARSQHSNVSVRLLAMQIVERRSAEVA